MTEATDLPQSVTLVGLLVEVGQGVGTVVRAVDNLAAVLARVATRSVTSPVVGLAFTSDMVEVGPLPLPDHFQLGFI